MRRKSSGRDFDGKKILEFEKMNTGVDDRWNNL